MKTFQYYKFLYLTIRFKLLSNPLEMPAKIKQPPKPVSKPYPPLSNTIVHQDGKPVTYQIIYGYCECFDCLYFNAQNYDVKWPEHIKKLYHEVVIKGQIVCPKHK